MASTKLNSLLVKLNSYRVNVLPISVLHRFIFEKIFDPDLALHPCQFNCFPTWSENNLDMQAGTASETVLALDLRWAA